MNATVAKREELAEKLHAADRAEAKEHSNPFANAWLVVLAVLLGGTLFCTAVLVAWPILAKMFAG